MTNLPLGWVIATLGEIAEINPRHPKHLPDSLHVSFAPMPALSTDRPEFEVLQERLLGEVRKGFTHFAEGDVLFAKITPCMENGKAAVATGLSNGLGCGTTELHVIRPQGNIVPHYVYQYLHQPLVRRQAEANFTGSAGQARVPVNFIESLEIPLPPLAEQRRIAAKLEELLGKVDACRKRLAKIPILLKRFRESVLAAACSGRLTADWREVTPSDTMGEETSGDLPNGWQSACVGDVIESLKYGTAQKCGYARRGVPVLRIPNVINATVDHTDLKYAELSPKEISQLRLFPGDILLIRSNGSVSLVGKSALVREAERGYAYAGYLIRLRPNRLLIEPEFLNIILNSFDVRAQIEQKARSTSGVNNINSEEVRGLRFPLPTLPEQHEIVRRVEALFALADQIEARYAKAKAHVDRLTQSILAKAFRGELVPQDPNDEPALAILEKIRAERLLRRSAPRNDGRGQRKRRTPRVSGAGP